MRYARELNEPVLLHVKTVKGKGYAPAEENPDAFHGVSPFSIQLPCIIIAYEFKLGKYIRLFSCNVTDYS